MRLLHEEGSPQLRASIRGFLPAIVTLAIFLAALGLLGIVFDSATNADSLGRVLLIFGAQCILYIGLIGMAIWIGGTVERRGYIDFGLKRDTGWIRTFAGGTIITVVGVILSLWWGQFRGFRQVSLAAGDVSGSGSPFTLAVVFVVFVLFFLLGNIYEEVIYRRILIQNFAVGLVDRGSSVKVAVIVATGASLLLFGAYHIPLRGNVVVAIDAVLVGITFSLAYLLTGELGLPVGIHFGRLPIEILHGLTLGGFEMSPIVEITQNTLPANLEVKAVRIGVTCAFIIAWVYLNRGEIALAESVYRQTDNRSVTES